MYDKYFLFMFSVSSLVSFSLGWLRCWCWCRLTYSIWISERRPFMPVDRYSPIIIIIITLMIVLEFKAFAVSVNCGCRARANGFCLCGGAACQTAPKHLSCTVVLRCGSGVCHSGTEAAHQHWHSSRLTLATHRKCHTSLWAARHRAPHSHRNANLPSVLHSEISVKPKLCGSGSIRLHFHLKISIRQELIITIENRLMAALCVWTRTASHNRPTQM